MLGRSRVVAGAVASVLLAGPVAAKPAPDPDAARRRDEAQALVKRAIAKSQAKDHPAAIDLYLQAYALVPLASLLSNVGTEYQQDKQPEQALKYFCMYLEKEPAGPLAGYATTQATQLEADLGDADTSTVCKPAAPVAAPALTPVEKPEPLPASSHRKEHLMLAGFATGGVGLFGIGLGIFFGARAANYSDQISNHPEGTAWDGFEDVDRAGKRAEKLQIGFLIGGGVMAAAGITMFVMGMRTPIQRDYVLAPTVSPDGTGFAFAGRF